MFNLIQYFNNNFYFEIPKEVYILELTQKDKGKRPQVFPFSDS